MKKMTGYNCTCCGADIYRHEIKHKNKDGTVLCSYCTIEKLEQKLIEQLSPTFFLKEILTNLDERTKAELISLIAFENYISIEE